MTSGTLADRRPWLILSRREAEALYRACLLSSDDTSEDLRRALHQIQVQIDWIDSGGLGQSSVRAALARQRSA
jgi:hypothetical protein